MNHVIPLVTRTISSTTTRLSVNRILFTMYPRFFPLFITNATPSISVFPSHFDLFRSKRSDLNRTIYRFGHFRPFSRAFERVVNHGRRAFILRVRSLVRNDRLPHFTLNNLLFTSDYNRNFFRKLFRVPNLDTSNYSNPVRDQRFFVTKVVPILFHLRTTYDLIMLQPNYPVYLIYLLTNPNRT